MPIFSSQPAATVRQRSPLQLPKLAYPAIFLAVLLAAFGTMYFRSQPSKVDVSTQATAKVCIHRPDFEFQHAWQETLSRAPTEVRENLQIESQLSGRQTVVAISLSRLPGESNVSMVNVVASAYAQACRSDWTLHLDQVCSAANEKVRQAERLASEAQTQFELLRDRRLRAMANLRPTAPPTPTTIENPAWTGICRRLAELETRRTTLLVDRTPLHPAVQEVDMLIADVHRAMASIPPRITQEATKASPPDVLPPDTPAPAEIDAAQQAADQLNQNLQQAQAAARAALAERGADLQIDLLAAEPPLPSAPAGPATSLLLGKALVTATTSIVGLGMISLGASAEPVLSSIADLQNILTVPIVGVIPATHPGRRVVTSAHRRRVARWGWMIAGLSVLFAVALLFFRG